MTDAVGEALRLAGMPTAGWRAKRVNLRAGELGFYERLLRAFPLHGGPPDTAWIRAEAERDFMDPGATLAVLAALGLIARDPRTGALTAAYPFSGTPTAPSAPRTRSTAGRSTCRCGTARHPGTRRRR